jgi:hypothetical protein
MATRTVLRGETYGAPGSDARRDVSGRLTARARCSRTHECCMGDFPIPKSGRGPDVGKWRSGHCSIRETMTAK